MTAAELAGIALGAIAIVAPAVWPAMRKAISYPIAAAGFVLLGWSGILALQDAMGIKIQPGPLLVIVIGLAIAASGLGWHIYRAKNSPASEKPQAAAAKPMEPKQVAPSPPSPHPPPEVVLSPQPAGREFVGAEITPDYLLGLFKSRTDAQAQNFTKPFLGKWMKLSISVYGVTVSNTFMLVSAAGDDNIFFTFRDSKYFSQLSALNKNDKITAIGKINSIKAIGIDLEDSELVFVHPK